MTPVLAVTSPIMWYLTRATGVAALVLLTAATVLGILTASRSRSSRWPRFAVSDLHRRISLVACVFLLLHIATTVLDSFVNISLLAVFVPFTAGYEPLWVGLGAVAFDLLLAVAVSSLLRRHISARSWRGIHWLALVCWPVAVLHAIETGTDIRFVWLQFVVGICIAAVLATVGWRLWERSRRIGPDQVAPGAIGPRTGESTQAPLTRRSPAVTVPGRPGRPLPDDRLVTSSSRTRPRS